MTIFTLDLSLTCVGWAVAKDGKVIAHGFILGRYDGIPRLIFLRNQVMATLEKFKPDLVMLEELAFRSVDGKAMERAGLSFMVQAELHSDNITYGQCNPASLKKFVVGRGGSKNDPVPKTLILKEIYAKFGHNVNNDDEADAIGIAYVAMALVGEWEPRIVAQVEVLETVSAKYPHLKLMNLIPEHVQAKIAGLKANKKKKAKVAAPPAALRSQGELLSPVMAPAIDDWD